MQDALTISTQKPADAAFDYEELRKTGIQYIEQTASTLWTDYNIHDPGNSSHERSQTFSLQLLLSTTPGLWKIYLPLKKKTLQVPWVITYQK